MGRCEEGSENVVENIVWRVDDVSTDYHPVEEIREAYGEEAAYFASPAEYENPLLGFDGGTPEQRGDKSDKDAYMMGIISLNYKIGRRRRNLPKF